MVLNHNLRTSILTFTTYEIAKFKILAELAYNIDNNYYNISTPNEKNASIFFEEFREKCLCFKQLFMWIIQTYGSFEKYDDRRIQECDNLYYKLEHNINIILESPETFWELMPKSWYLIHGNNLELDYFIDEYINEQLM
jgi:hypothetical protein